MADILKWFCRRETSCWVFIFGVRALCGEITSVAHANAFAPSQDPICGSGGNAPPKINSSERHTLAEHWIDVFFCHREFQTRCTHTALFFALLERAPPHHTWVKFKYIRTERSSVGLRATCSRKGRHRFLHDLVKLFPVVALCMLELMKFHPDIHKKVKKTRLRSFQILALLMPLWAPPHFFASWYVRATRDEFNIHQIWS
jgi:hypothetical protein